MRKAYFGGEPTAVVSAEGLQNAPGARLEALRELLDGTGIEVTVVAYIRSIYDHCWSGYQQLIKRHGYYGDLAEYAATYRNMQVDAVRLWSAAFDDIRLINYDSAKESLIESFFETCELDLPAELSTSRRAVNRSLSAAERALLIDVNRQAAERGLEFKALLSDALIYADPDKPSGFVYDADVLAVLREKYERRGHLAQPSFPRATIRSGSSRRTGARTSRSPRIRSPPEVRMLIGALLDQIVRPARHLRRTDRSERAPARGREGKGRGMTEAGTSSAEDRGSLGRAPVGEERPIRWMNHPWVVARINRLVGEIDSDRWGEGLVRA